LMATPKDMSYDLDGDELNVSESDEEIEEEKPKFGIRAWVVLLIAALVRCLVQWQRSVFSFAFGYTGTGAQFGDPFYELSTAYPALAANYGTLTGLAYTLPFALFGLYVGKITESANRKWALAIVIALAASTMGLTGAFNSLFILGAMRVMHGMVNSATNPLSFSLIGDYFPPDKRATANSIIHSGQYCGTAMGSISILLISKFGWRATYGLMSGISLAVAAMIALLVKEPKRGVYLTKIEKQKEAEKK
jgi:MFS family permease